SFTRQYLDLLRGNNVPDHFQISECTFAVPFAPTEFPSGQFVPVDCSTFPGIPNTIKPTNVAEINQLRVAVDGAFKTASLRNVSLTQPYFHNGGQWTLEQVVTFYNRGGDRTTVVPGQDNNDTTGFNNVPSNLDANIRVLNLTDAQKADLVAFLRHGL